jgi:polyphosphate glucokinase
VAVIGVDIGGSGIKAAPVDVSAGRETRERERVETPRPATVDGIVAGVEQILAVLADAGCDEQDEHGAPRPLGVTFPGVVVGGEIRTAANVDRSWIGVDLAGLLADRLGRRVAVLNDADAAGLAEVGFGAARGVSGVVVTLTFGTGIGSALFTDGRLVPNTELGHLEWQGEDAEKRAAASVREAKGWSWKKWAERAGGYIGLIEQLFTPQLVVIGGGVAKHAEKWLDHLDVSVRCVPAALANEAGIIGAAMAAVASADGPRAGR